VWAVRDGRDVSERMHTYLKAKLRSADAKRAEPEAVAA
jgi:hypothetical protein